MAQKWQGRRKDGKFLPSIAREGFNAPKPRLSPVVPQVKTVSVAVEEKISSTTNVVFSPLAEGEAQRMLHALSSALRSSNTRADRVAQTVERSFIESRFGSINWAA